MATIIKNDGTREPYSRSILTQHLASLTSGLSSEHLKLDEMAHTIERGMLSEMTARSFSELVSQAAAYLACNHPDYALLAGRLAATHLHKHTKDDLLETFTALYEYTSEKTCQHSPLITKEVYEVAARHAPRLQGVIDYSKDLVYDYFGFKTLEKSYLLKMEDNGVLRVVERPQQMLMRVSLGIHYDDIDAVVETYKYLSEGYFTHASPTLFNAGTPTPQMSSCFLVAMKADSIEGIFDTLSTCANISKTAGGIGLHVHDVRSKGSFIKGTNGESKGLLPMLRLFNASARYVHQGGGKRKGSVAIYLEPWHADVFEFLALKKNTGKDEERARDLFYGLWVPDLFMKRVHENGSWSLFDPALCQGLSDAWGPAFEDLYTRYEKEGRAIRTVKAHDLWFAIVESQIETGTPYLMYKDSCNAKSNQQHLGTIKCSNLCTEIVEYTAPDEVAVCNLASLALPKFLKADPSAAKGRSFDHDALSTAVQVVTRNLNRVVDRNHYPVGAARKSNMRHRPIGLGVQGLADLFAQLALPFASTAAGELQEDIFETIYFAALTASCALAKEAGAFETYAGSPMSQGKLQFDLWRQAPRRGNGLHDWDGLRAAIAQHGVRNSLLVAPMPTASTSQILGNNECFEPFTSNIYVRRVMAGEFPVVNKHLVKDLCALGLWNEDVKQLIIADNGSVQNVPSIPADLKELYKTVWEISQKVLIDQAAARAKYIDQSQSLNLFLPSPTRSQVTSMHFYAWRKGLKTGQYYLRTRPAAEAVKVTVDPAMLAAAVETQRRNKEEGEAAATAAAAAAKNLLDESESECIACGS